MPYITQWEIYMGQPKNKYYQTKPTQLVLSIWYVFGKSLGCFFPFKFSKFFKFSDILFILNKEAKLEAFPINLIIFIAPPVQLRSSGCTWLTYFPPPSHCATFCIKIMCSRITNKSLFHKLFLQSR